MVQKRRLVKHSFWVKKTYYLAQRQNLWEYTGTIKNKHKFRMILFGLSRPFQSLWMSPACGQDYLGLPRLTHAYPSSIGLQINNWCPCSVRQLSAYSKKLFARNSFCVHCSYIFKCQKRLSYSVPESNG